MFFTGNMRFLKDILFSSVFSWPLFVYEKKKSSTMPKTPTMMFAHLKFPDAPLCTVRYILQNVLIHKFYISYQSSFTCEHRLHIVYIACNVHRLQILIFLTLIFKVMYNVIYFQKNIYNSLCFKSCIHF